MCILFLLPHTHVKSDKEQIKRGMNDRVRWTCVAMDGDVGETGMAHELHMKKQTECYVIHF